MPSSYILKEKKFMYREKTKHQRQLHTLYIKPAKNGYVTNPILVKLSWLPAAMHAGKENFLLISESVNITEFAIYELWLLIS